MCAFAWLTKIWKLTSFPADLPAGQRGGRRQPWRDTLLIGPEQTTETAFVADNPGKWRDPSHMPEHAAAGMTTAFTIA
ncbi:multicopper oxidase domain-containing protein [Hoeflea sp. YIM 152468]|uniref:multicopper oxidase domain-containing protein n=1 Tax=Hoeflea sp. YIM 152468 TaxID=3031759 RepID=UPI0023DBC91A|nr:multicopper oxidase domain-containing protein [Hoeflea sp. YIM 152468]MDF1608623.1 multicopper oxidase domain-containing protein [Hoeflea sp. YIM 152468]